MSYGIGSEQGGIPVQKQGDIANRLECLQDMAKQFHAIAAALDARLGPVITPTMTGEGKSVTSGPRPVLAPVVTRLDEIRDDFQRAADQINNIIDRVAL